MTTEVGLKQISYNVRVFYHEQKNLRVVVRGDDIRELGVSESSAPYRIVMVTVCGLEYEADQRHAEILRKEMGVDGESW